MHAESQSPQLLEERGVFRFEDSVHQAVESFFGELGGPSRSDAATALILRELAYLSAAEFSLAPLLIEPKPTLPISEPLVVDAGSAMLALIKTNCISIEWPCLDTSREGRHLNLNDVTAFSGDVRKLEVMGLSSQNPPEEIGALLGAVERLESLHQAASTELAKRVGASGVIRIQGFLWVIKLGLPREPVAELIGNAFEAFELTQPAGAAMA